MTLRAAPLPWNVPPPRPFTSRADARIAASEARHTYGEYCLSWAQANPVETLTVILPIWYAYATVAPSLAAFGQKNRGFAHLIFVISLPVRMAFESIGALIATPATRVKGK